MSNIAADSEQIGSAQPKVVWRPTPGSQALALSCPANEIIYDGSRGPGKTDCQLMRFRRHVGKGYGHFWRGIIFDREYKNLDDIITKSKRWFPQFGDGAKFLSSTSDLRWVWPSGEELLFRQIKRANDYYNYHGHEYPFIGWNELTKYPTSELYEAMQSCNRTSFVPTLHSPVDKETGIMNVLPPIPLEIFATTNPYGPGHGWVKRYWIDPTRPGVPYAVDIEVFDPRTQQRIVVRKYRARIFGSYKENRFLTPEYVATLESISDPNKREAWLRGNWDIVAGGALDDVWGPHIIVPRFKVPAGWRVTRSFDWGSTHPFSVGWWAHANGEEVVLPGGKKWGPKPGTLIRIAEWYGCKEIGSNKGLKLSARSVARGILEREAAMREQGWVVGEFLPGPADNQIGNEMEEGEETIRRKMEDEGVYWTQSNKSPGSRTNGLQLMRDRLEASKTGEGPGFFITDNCVAARAILPTLPRDEDNQDDVDTDAEDHLYDEARYQVLEVSNVASVQPFRH